MLCFAVFFPILTGILLFLIPDGHRRIRNCLAEAVSLLTSAMVFYLIFKGQGTANDAFPIAENLLIRFSLDGTGTVFAGLAAFLWPLATLYAFEYMHHEGGERPFFALYIISFGVTLGIALADNLVTMYIFYEFLSLSTLPMVMHGSSEEAQRAGFQYMMFTFGGAALALVGVIPAVVWGGNTFSPGGALEAALFETNPALMQVLFLCMTLGFGVKAAMFPFHSWLPVAAVAPTPVTALLHAAAVVKAGAFAVIRVCYFTFGAEHMRGTAAQNALLLMASVTIVYGAFRAVREHHLKRRLAWSTVSNLSYIIMAAALLTRDGMTAAMAHLLFHALIKITLFYCAGAVLVQTNKTEIESMRGLSKEMPFTSAVYAIAALALAGTPLLPAFVSKWMIGNAAVSSGNVFGYVGLAAVLIAAVLSALYVLYPAFFMLFCPADDADTVQVRREPGLCMIISMAVLTLAIFACGFFSNSIITFIADAAAQL